MPLKDQKLSEESVEKMRKSKHAKLAAKYNWDLVKDYMDAEINLSSRGRTNSYITLSQFKEMIEAGTGIRKMNKQTSRSLIGFFSALCQGKITLSKEKFVAEYNKGKSLETIAIENKISKDYIGYLRQLYGVKSKGATFIRRKNTEVPLTQRQKEIIYGSLMGDAKRLGSNAIIAFGHGPKQEKYLRWKFEELKSIMSPRSLKKYSSIDKRSGNTSEKWCCYGYSNTDVERINEKFYSPDGKEITNDILSCLTPLSIAVWYMDDGNTGWSLKSRQKHPNWNHLPEMQFCTDSFSKESCENIINWFKHKWNINCHLRERGKKKNGGMMYRVIIDASSVEDFIHLISPHILSSLKYKINYKAYLKWREEKEIINEENYFDEWWQEDDEEYDIFEGN